MIFNMLVLFTFVLISTFIHSSAMSTKEQNFKLSREVDMNFERYDLDKSLRQKISSWRANHVDEYSKFRSTLRMQQRKAKRLGLESVVDQESKMKSWPQQRLRSTRKGSKLRKIRY
ncbi:uncharacterized protein FA14DRAFT_27877 [Meira miltonrushii]|uniref:Uncharacterized protein n=1 Tax=Meira miltonrushii TaxID=1280837 RepID=A0A316VQW3_9BASI|nr:uncharacterized protein FA14DRAFT_27877 [Meira miltonrushii]PWN38561.1 hypothetical protein FA14DRAFT_27877 [Meira miltonrushii]